MRTLLYAVIHNAVVTNTVTLWPVALRVDAFVLHAHKPRIVMLGADNRVVSAGEG